MKVPERNNKLKNGLIDMINYINQFYNTHDLSICEVGCWTGCASEIFANHFKQVTCIDAWENNLDDISSKYDMKMVEILFNERMKLYPNISKIKGYSIEVAKKVDSFDIVYIDACHTYEAVKADIKAWKNKAKLYLCGHDYWKGKFDGVIKAVNEYKKPDKIFKDTSWLIGVKA